MTTTTTRPLWIGPDESLAVGQTGFLIRHWHETKGWVRFDLRDTPARTNVSLEYRLSGWCGSYDNISTTARGMVRVTRVAKNGRALVAQLTGAELTAALEDLGYPELDSEAAEDAAEDATEGQR